MLTSRSAQRMPLHLLERNRDTGRHLASVLEQAMREVARCKRCRLLYETALCNFCMDKNRAQDLLCVVKSPSDGYIWL